MSPFQRHLPALLRPSDVLDTGRTRGPRASAGPRAVYREGMREVGGQSESEVARGSQQMKMAKSDGTQPQRLQSARPSSSGVVSTQA